MKGRKEEQQQEKTAEPEERPLTILLTLLREERGPSGTPLSLVRKRLTQLLGSPSKAEQTIQKALDQHLIDKVIDYEEKDRDTLLAEPTWHLKLLTPKERKERRKLSSADQALLRLLFQQNHPLYLGRIPQEEARRRLWAQGHTEEETERAVQGIPGLTEVVWAKEWHEQTLKQPKDIKWIRLTHEYERHPTPQEKREQERTHREFLEKELEYQLLVEELEGKRKTKRKGRG